MSVQTGETLSSSTSRLTHSQRSEQKQNYKYYKLSGSSTWNSSNNGSKPCIAYPAKHVTKRNHLVTNADKPTKSSPHGYAYNVSYKTTLYCSVIIICTVLMILSRKIQNQTITKYNHQYLQFRHQWIQTWFYFLSKTLLITLIITPCYNKSFGISETFHSQIILAQTATINRRKPIKSFIMQQCVYCILAICLVFAQFLLNIALYYIPGSIWIIMTSIILVYVSMFKFFSVEPSIIVFIGVFCIITGNVMMMTTQIHQLQIIASFDTKTIIFGFLSLCIGLLFMTFYYMIYQHYYNQYRAYCNLLIKLKTLRKSRYQAFDKSDFLLKHDLDNNIVFYHWNHYKILYIEGIYGLLFTSIILFILLYFDICDELIHSDHWLYYWFYENIKHFGDCIVNNPVHIVMLIVYIISVASNDIALELSKSYLSAFHSKIIYVATIMIVWCIDLLLHLIFTPNVDKSNNVYDAFYGEIATWYTALEGGAMLFIVLGVFLFDEKYVVYLNGMMEHNGLILKQQRINQLTKYWNEIYYRKEKERLCGFSPMHLRREHDVYDIESVKKNVRIHRDILDIEENKEESSANYQELSINSYNREGTKLEGTMNLLIGDGVSSALTQGPSKYYPALYE